VFAKEKRDENETPNFSNQEYTQGQRPIERKCVINRG
jgi:hypothetical protein